MINILAASLIILIILQAILLTWELYETKQFRSKNEESLEIFNALLEHYSDLVTTINGNASESNQHYALTTEHEKKIGFLLATMDAHAHALSIYSPVLKDFLREPKSKEIGNDDDEE